MNMRLVEAGLEAAPMVPPPDGDPRKLPTEEEVKLIVLAGTK